MAIPGYTPQHRFQVNYRPDNEIIGLVEGRFIMDGTIIFLKLENGTVYNLDDVAITSYAFNTEEGVLRYPQPSQFDKQGNQLIQGDIVIIGFRKGKPDNPIVLGSIIPLNVNEFFHAFEYDNFKQRKIRLNSDQATVEYQDNGSGEIQLDITAKESDDENGTGNIVINLTGFNEDDDGLNGSITINVNGSVNINTEKQVNITAQTDVNVTTQATANVTAAGAVTVKSDESATVDSPEIYLGKDSTEPLILGNTWSTLYQAHIHGTPTGPSGPPTNAANASQCLSSQNKTL